MSVAPGHLLEQLLDLQADPLDLLQVAAEDLHAHHGAEAGLQHDEAGLDRLQQRRQHAGNRGLRLKLGEDFILGDAAVLRPDPAERLFFSQPGQSENHRFTGMCRHSDSGLRMMMLSIMPMGAGSSADSARPSLPTTDSTSGTLAIAMSCRALTSQRGAEAGLRQQRRHVEERAFVERRHELAADARQYSPLLQDFDAACRLGVALPGIRPPPSIRR